MGLDPSSVVSDRVDNNDSTGAKVDALAAAAAAGEASVAVVAAAAAVEGEHGGGAGVEPATAAQTSHCGYTILWMMAPDDDSTFQERRTDKEGTPVVNPAVVVGM